MTLQAFVKKKSHLFWSTKNLDNLSLEVIVETILNYGDFDDVKKIISILGIKKVADIFNKQKRRKRNNYRPEIKNYFSLYFDKYVS